MSKLEILSILMDFDISFYFPKIKRIRYKKFVAKQRRSSLRSSLSRNPWKKKKKKTDISISISCNYIEMHTFLFLFLICEKVRRKGRIRSKAPPFDHFFLSLFFLHRCKRPPPTRREIEASLIRASSTLIPPNGYYTAKAKLLIRRVMDPNRSQLIRVARPYRLFAIHFFESGRMLYRCASIEGTERLESGERVLRTPRFHAFVSTLNGLL